MKSRRKPDLPRSAGTHQQLESSIIKKAIASLVEHLKGLAPEPRLFGFDDHDLYFINSTALRKLEQPFDPHLFLKAMQKTQRLLAFPRITDLAADIRDMLTQPEMLDFLWNPWQTASGRRGPKGSTVASKALMVVTAVAGQSAHLLHNWHLLDGNTKLARAFEDAEADAGRRLRRKPAMFELRGYEQCLKHVRGLSESVYDLCLSANIQMHLALQDLFRDPRYGTWGLIDGSDVAAWCSQQRGQAANLAVRAQLPHAGGRLIAYGPDGKVALPDGKIIHTYASGKFWRGYYLIVLVEAVTGLPLVWTLWDAAWDEAKALKELLWRLYTLWPDCPLVAIAGDGAWDEKWANEFCRTQYGIHMIARRTPSHRKVDHSLSFFESESFHLFTGEGRAFCRAHHHELPYNGADLQTNRLRFTCPDGCGKPGLSMRHHWSALTYYPHHPNGRPDLHAMRLALLARRNACESLFSSLKVGNKLGLRGASRTRLREFEKVQALVSLALTFKTAAVLADQRTQRGLTAHAPSQLAA